MVRSFYCKACFLVLLLFWLGCNSRHSQDPRPLFNRKCIQDSLNCILSKIDSTLDPDGIPPITFVILYEVENQCLIDFYVEFGWLTWPLKDTCATESFGMCRYSGHLLWIGGNPKYKRLLNDNKLRLTKDDKQFLKQKEKLMSGEHIVVYGLHREYLFSPPDSLVLLKSGR